MHVGRFYTVKEVFFWTLRETLVFVFAAAIPTLAWALFGQKWLSLPWQPVALVGTAVAFVTGFKNNAAYGRLWEARQIYGSIVNLSRTWAVQVLDLVTSPPEVKRALIYRHLAWLTAMRFQLRESRNWERVRVNPADANYTNFYDVAEWKTELPAELKGLIEEGELKQLLTTKNRATHLLAAQSRALTELSARGETTELRFVELQRSITGLYDAQGRAERIKNFPYPRQFSTLNTYFIWLLSVSLPFALLPELEKLGSAYAWLCIPVAATVSWIFFMIDKIGEASENPFCGGPNDVPITALSRTIEIDLRELLGETPPPPIQPRNLILM